MHGKTNRRSGRTVIESYTLALSCFDEVRKRAIYGVDEPMAAVSYAVL